MIAESSLVESAITLLVMLAIAGLAVVALRKHQSNQKVKRDQVSQFKANVIAPRLGAAFHPDDTDHLAQLPFVAFTEWPTRSKVLSNVESFPGPFGLMSHAFEYT